MQVLSGFKVLGRKGEEVVFFLNGKYTHIQKVPHIYSTRKLSLDEAKEIYREVKTLKGIHSAYISQFNQSNYVVVAEGERGLYNLLPEAFNRISSPDVLRYRYQPLSLVDVLNDKISTRKPNFDVLLKFPLLAIDTERDTERWRKEREGVWDERYSRTNAIAAVWDGAEKVFSIFKGDDLIEAIEGLVGEVGPFYLAAHNLTYDLTESILNEAKIGVDQSTPIIKGSQSYPQKPEVAGRQLLDTYSFAQKWLWCLKNDLESVAKFFDVFYNKSLDYGELEKLVYEAESKGDKLAVDRILQYCLEDCKTHYQLAKKILPIALKLAIGFETDLTSVCYNSKSNLAQKLRDKLYFSKKHTPRWMPSEVKKALGDFDIFEEKAKMLKELLDNPWQRGVFSEVGIYYPRFLSQTFEELIRRQSPHNFYSWAELSNSPVEKIIYEEALDAYSKEILFDLLRPVPDYVFKGRYGAELKLVKRALENAIKRTAALAGDKKIVNITPRFIYIQTSSTLPSELFTFLGVADKSISVASGVVISLLEGKLMGEGIDLEGVRGYRCGLKNIVGDFVSLYLAGQQEEAFNILKECYLGLRDGSFPKEQLLIEANVRREIWDYTDPALEREVIRAARGLGSRGKEKIKFGFGMRNGKPTYLSEEEFLSSPVNWGKYLELFFGGENIERPTQGIISRVAYSTNPKIAEILKGQRFLF